MTTTIFKKRIVARKRHDLADTRNIGASPLNIDAPCVECARGKRKMICNGDFSKCKAFKEWQNR